MLDKQPVREARNVMINHLSKFGRFLLLMGLAMILTGCQSTKMKQATAENENPIDVQEQDTSGTSSVERDSAFNNTVITDPDTPSGAKSLSSSNPPESGGKTDAKLFRDIDTHLCQKRSYRFRLSSLFQQWLYQPMLPALAC